MFLVKSVKVYLKSINILPAERPIATKAHSENGVNTEQLSR